MSEMIRRLFRGDLQLLQRPFLSGTHENIAFDEAEQKLEEMKQKIPPEFHYLLEQYQTAMMNLMDAACEKEYLSGYQLGVRMMVAAWPENGRAMPAPTNVPQCRGDH